MKPCPCCGYLVFDEEPGSYSICPICYWEDDAVQLQLARLWLRPGIFPADKPGMFPADRPGIFRLKTRQFQPGNPRELTS